MTGSLTIESKCAAGAGPSCLASFYPPRSEEGGENQPRVPPQERSANSLENIPMHRRISPCLLLSALVFCFFNSPAIHAQTPGTVTTETGNNTSACSGVGDPAGLQIYCAGNFAGFNTATGNTNAQTQVVDPIPGHVSSVKLINYLYSGAPTKFIAAYQPWFCATGPSGPYNGTQTCTIASAGYHKIVGYDENDELPKPGIIPAQDKLMIAEGFWAVSPDWYGPSTGRHSSTTP